MKWFINEVLSRADAHAAGNAKKFTSLRYASKYSENTVKSSADILRDFLRERQGQTHKGRKEITHLLPPFVRLQI